MFSRPSPFLVAAVCCLIASEAARAADYAMQVTSDAGLSVRLHETELVTTRYVFWGADWDFAGAELQLEPTDEEPWTIEGRIRELNVEVTGRVGSPEANQLRYTWKLDPREPLAGIIGGGLEFNLQLNSPALGGGAREPELLEGNRGWRWTTGEGEQIRVEFEPAAEQVYFERGNRETIRAFFIGEEVAAQPKTLSMTVTLPTGGEVTRSARQRYGAADTDRWYRGALPHDGAPVDLSHLNHGPAGKHGQVRVDGERFVFADGTPVRFWGGNIAAYAIFSDKDDIERQARRIAALGYNLMRFHHHDSTRWVGRTVIDTSRDDSQHLDEEVMDRLDWWIKCLKDNGVYVFLDLHVGREMSEADEIGPGWADLQKHVGDHGAEIKGFNYFNDRVTELMQKFNRDYLNRVNRYTGVAYKDEPAVMGLLLTNENDLTNHFGNRMLGDKGHPWHNRVFQEAVEAFATEHGLDAAATGQTWLHGPSKIFLADREAQWNLKMIEHLREMTADAPVCTTHMWGGMAMSGLPPLTVGDFIDVHSYGRPEALSVNPRYKDNYISYVATGAAHGYPVTITEWNVPYPAVDRFTAPLYMASIAALQEWDAPMIYNYSQQAVEAQSRQHTWSTYTDPALTGMMPAAAMLYREQHVKPAREHYMLRFTGGNMYLNESKPANMASLRTLVERSKLTIGLPDLEELDWDRASRPGDGVVVLDDLDRDFLPEGAEEVTSDTGELRRNWVDGYQVIDTAKSQAVHGWIGGERFDTGAARFEIETPKAAVALTALDDEPIERSQRILITAMARVVGGPQNRMPLLSEPVEGTIRIAAPAGLKLVPLAGDGERLDPVEAPYREGRYTVTLPAPRGTHWFELRR